MGAMTALTFATRHPERLRTLVVAGITTPREPRWATRSCSSSMSRTALRTTSGSTLPLAAWLYAVDHHVDRLADDHAHARLLAETCGVDPATVDTNIVVVDVPDAPAVVAAAREHDVLVSAVGPTALRLVTNLEVGRDQAEVAASVLTKVLASTRPTADGS